MAFETYPEVEAQIKKAYPKVDRVTMTPINTVKGVFFQVGMSMSGMALAGQYKAGKDFIESLRPLYSELLSITESVRRQEAEAKGDSK